MTTSSNSLQSSVYSFKQVLSVSSLTYEDEEIIFEYDASLVDLEESGIISFMFSIIKDGVSILSTEYPVSSLVDDKVALTYVPTEAGQYNVKVYVKSANLEDSI